MRLPLAYCLVFAFAAAPAASSQGILPDSLPAGYAAKSANPPAARLAGAADATASVLKEYGATSAEQKTYVHGGNSIVATVYSFCDASGAYGAYSFLRTPEMPPARFAEFSSLSGDRALVLSGNTVLEITGTNLKSDSAQITPLAASAIAHAQRGVYPSLPLLMPDKGRIPRTARYFLGPLALGKFWHGPSGDWLGFSRGAEAEVAQYELAGRDAKMLLVDYPTPQIAASQFQKLTADFKLTGAGDIKTSDSGLYARRDGSLVAMLKGARSPKVAGGLLDQVHSDLVLTWDLPVLKHREPSMGTMLVGTFVGTAEICAFTLLGGVFFTLIRLGVKRLWPGRLFDRPEDMEIIQLGLSTKPIKAKDFY